MEYACERHTCILHITNDNEYFAWISHRIKYFQMNDEEFISFSFGILSFYSQYKEGNIGGERKRLRLYRLSEPNKEKRRSINTIWNKKWWRHMYLCYVISRGMRQVSFSSAAQSTLIKAFTRIDTLKVLHMKYISIIFAIQWVHFPFCLHRHHHQQPTSRASALNCFTSVVLLGWTAIIHCNCLAVVDIKNQSIFTWYNCYRSRVRILCHYFLYRLRIQFFNVYTFPHASCRA